MYNYIFRISIICILFGTNSILQGMQTSEKPSSAITLPQEFTREYKNILAPGTLGAAERHKFEQYDLDHPAKFLEKMRRQLNSDNPFTYLKNLQLFASLLLYQDTVFRNLSKESLMQVYSHYLEKKRDDPLKFLGAREEESIGDVTKLAFFNTNPEATNQLLLYNNLLMKFDFTKDELRSVIYPWVISKNEQLQALGQFSLSKQELHLLWLPGDIKEFEEIMATFRKLFEMPENDFIDQKVPALIKDNIVFSNTKQENDTKFEKQRKQTVKISKNPQSASNEITSQSWIANLKLVVNYYLVFPYYQKLYELIRQEINETIKQQIQANPGNKDLARTLILFNQNLVKNPEGPIILAPKNLPASLAPFNNPLTSIQLPSLNEEVAKFKVEAEQKKRVEIEAKKAARKKKKEAAAIAKATSISEERKEVELESQKIKEAPDGSFILEDDETENRITIHNPAHKTTEVIFKTSKPFSIKQEFKPQYTDWVKEWFTNPEQALIDQGYTSAGPKLTAKNLRWKPIAIHGFSPLIDLYIIQWGTQTTVPNRRNPRQMDILITIPGMMIYRDGAEETGVYAYLIDSQNGQWYHRMFEEQKGQKLVKDLWEKGYFSPEMSGYYDVAFPPLPGKK